MYAGGKKLGMYKQLKKSNNHIFSKQATLLFKMEYKIKLRWLN